ncbi:hypothetical protein GF312_00075 [Candidatus Poribacteria bacterium]|nr:hypothetical protein [Candidatus Poribacteria bacterium]
MKIYPKSIDAAFEYDDNVTRQGNKDNYQYGIIWRLYTGFGIKDFLPLKRFETKAEYDLGMRDVNTTNNEDYSSHKAKFNLGINLWDITKLNVEDNFNLWNSQSDLFNFLSNNLTFQLDQQLGSKTFTNILYNNGTKRFQNDIPEVQARSFISHQLGINIDHKISEDFTVKSGYIYNYTIYNRRPVEFRSGRPVALEGTQRDRQNIITLGFRTGLLKNMVNLTILNQVVMSKSNSPAFNFDGNRTRLMLLVYPTHKLWIEAHYQIAAYDLGVYQTPEKGYELSDIRTDDQSFITLNITYSLSDQLDLKLRYEHIKNDVFFTREFYKKNTVSAGIVIRF